MTGLRAGRTHPGMNTPTRQLAHLTTREREQLRVLIDQTVRALTTTPHRYACPECGADTRGLPTAVSGCETCHDRFAARRRRRSA
jgi:hypothetical protein